MKNTLNILVFLILTVNCFAQQDTINNSISEEPIYISLDGKMPVYPGNIRGLQKDIVKNVEYPKAAIDLNIQGTVYLRFVVTKTGDIAAIEVVRGVHPLLDTAAINAVRKLKRFTPGEEHGQKVNAWFSVPIAFKTNGTLDYSTTKLQLDSAKIYWLPKEIGNFKQLDSLSLSSTHLTKLPQEIGKLNKLIYLDLSDNQLTELPFEISNLKNLQTLNLSNNQLTKLPKKISRLTSLKKLNLSHNNFSKNEKRKIKKRLRKCEIYF